VKIIKLLAYEMHRRIFGQEMGEMMEKFLNHLSWSFLGIFFNGIILFGVNVLAGRILGPEGYGKYNLVLVVANILSIFILLGLDITSIKYISGSEKAEDKKQYLSNSFFIVLVSSLLVFIFFFSPIFNLFHLEKNIFLVAAIFAIIMSFRTLLDSFIKSFNFFKFQSIVKLFEGVAILLSFFFFFFIFRISNYQYYIASLAIGYLSLCAIYFLKISGKIVRWNNQKFKDIIKYSKTTIILTVIGIIMASMDRIFVGKFLGIQKLGIYSAYLMSTTIFVGQIILIFDNVFLPMINRIENKEAIIKKIDRLFVVLFIPCVFLIFSFSFIIMKIFGKEFQSNILYILIFSILAFFQIVGTFYRSIVSSIKKSYIRLQKISCLLPILLFLLYLFISVKNNSNLNYYILAYSFYVTLNLIIIRKSYINAK
jgi:O-antigen/teichoic acid export membrane protein